MGTISQPSARAARVEWVRRAPATKRPKREQEWEKREYGDHEAAARQIDVVRQVVRERERHAAESDPKQAHWQGFALLGPRGRTVVRRRDLNW